jgi:large subunit ribosomal protein L15
MMVESIEKYEISLSNLKPPSKFKKKKRVGRGYGSGHGVTAGRGTKGQKSRSGFSLKRGFEGGQMPLHRRVPKRGFTNIFREEYAIVNIGMLKRFKENEEINPQSLVEAGLIKKSQKQVKILGHGELTIPLTVKAHKISQSAQNKIEKAGGRVEIIGKC